MLSCYSLLLNLGLNMFFNDSLYVIEDPLYYVQDYNPGNTVKLNLKMLNAGH